MPADRPPEPSAPKTIGTATDPRRPIPRLRPPWALALIALAVFALLGWQGISTVGRTAPLDAGEYLLNAQYLNAHGHLPPDYISYEFSAPPLYEAAAIALEHVVRAVPAVPLELGSNVATRILWLLLVTGSAMCLISSRSRARIAGIAGLAVGGLWGLDEAVALGRSQTWSAGQLLSLAAGMGLVVVSALIAQEIWPGHPRLVLGTAAFVLAYPVVLQLGVLFHPETTAALVLAVAILLLLRAGNRGWPVTLGIAAGVACGLGLLTRQSAIVVLLCAPFGALLAGGRRAGRFTIALVAAAALVAGPWLVYADASWGNPFQGNLERPGNMLPNGEPLSFYVSFPIGSLVTHPTATSWQTSSCPSCTPISGATGTADFPQLVGLAVAHRPADRVEPERPRPRGGRARDRRPARVRATAAAAPATPPPRRAERRSARLPRASLRRGSPGADRADHPLPAAGRQGDQGELSPVHGTLLGCVLGRRVGRSVAPAGSQDRAGRGRRPVRAQLRDEPRRDVLALLPTAAEHRREPGLRHLNVSIARTSPLPGAGGELDLAVYVENRGTKTATDTKLEIDLPPGTRLIGPPSFDRGFGCTGSQTVNCFLDFIPPGVSATVRFGLRTTSGVARLTARASSFEVDAHPADNIAFFTMRLGTFS